MLVEYEPSMPNLPHYINNKHCARNRTQNFEVKDGITFIEKPMKSIKIIPELKPSNSAKVGNELPSVLCFQAFFKEDIFESTLENCRIRRCNIIFYLKDGTMQVDEIRTENSGIPQGSFVKRRHIPQGDTAGSNLGLSDLDIGNSVMIYGREFHIVDANSSTKDYLKNVLKREIKDSITFPVTHFDEKQNIEMNRQKNGDYRRFKSEMKSYAEAKLGNTVNVAKRAGFVKYDKEVLAFDAFWDDSDALFGEKHRFKLHYYLQDDTIEVANITIPNSGRMSFPLLLKRSILPKNNKDMYKWSDLYVGAIIIVYRRPLLLTNADQYTRNYYIGKGQPLGLPISMDPEPVQAQPRKMPPYTGFGTDEDSLASCTGSIVLSPLHRPKGKRVILRFSADIISPFREDVGRQFVITVYGEDGTISIREPPRPNSGYWGGTFLSRSRVQVPNTYDQLGNMVFLGLHSFKDGVESVVVINGHNFKLTDADESTKKLLQEMHI